MSKSQQSPELKRARNAWLAMKRRCLRPKSKDWANYGGRGIRVCEQWLTSFDQFLADMGLPPNANSWLGRLDVNGHYCPGNVIWTERTAQVNRRRCCRKLTLEGRTMTAAQAGRLAGKPSSMTLVRRWERGLSLDLPRIDKRSTWLTHQGLTLPIPEWTRRLNLRPTVIAKRLSRGMPVEIALTPGHVPRGWASLISKP